MGTNYYLHVKPCQTCHHPEKQVHIGKSSGGWSFSFHGYPSPWDEPKIHCYQDWIDYIRSLGSEAVIKDEYGETRSLEFLMKLVENKRAEPYNHTLYSRIHHPEHAERDCWLDDQGNSFSKADFS